MTIDTKELRQALGAVQPEEVEELLDRLEAAEKERDVLRGRLALESQENGALRDSVDRACEERDALRIELDEIRYGVAVAHDTIKALRAAMEPTMQDALMKFDPAAGEERPYPSHAIQWRSWHGTAAWLFDPWTGKRRNAYDVGSDVHGLLIVPAGTLGMDMGGGCAATNKGVMKRAWRESK